MNSRALLLMAAFNADTSTGCRYVNPQATSLQFEVTPECLWSATYVR